MPLDEFNPRTAPAQELRADVRPADQDRGTLDETRARTDQSEREAHPDDGDDGGEGGQREQRRQRRSRRVWFILGAVALVLVIVGTGWWLATRNEETTDDAYTDGNVVSIAPQVSGYVVQLAVTDNQFLHKGDLILRIDPRDYDAAVEQARGQLEAARGQLDAARFAVEVAKQNFPARLESAKAQRAAADATLTRAEADLRRQRAVPRAATTQENLDQAIAAEAQARAQVAEADAAVAEATPVQPNISQTQAEASQLEGQVIEAEAKLRQAQLNLGYTELRAPQDGWVTRRNVNQGDYLSPGGAVMSLVTTDVWVTANFKENQLDRMRPGQKVAISVDAYPGLKLKGHVDSIQLGSGSKFSAFPAENATGNFVKIVQRVPVKIDIDSGMDPNLPLPLGISVGPTVALK